MERYFQESFVPAIKAGTKLCWRDTRAPKAKKRHRPQVAQIPQIAQVFQVFQVAQVAQVAHLFQMLLFFQVTQMRMTLVLNCATIILR
jgi:hypothetical protein